MRFAVLGSPDSWYTRDLQRAAADRHEVLPLAFSTIAAGLDANGLRIHSAGNALADFDAVLVRTMPPGSLEQVVFRMDCLLQHEAAGGLILNSPRAVETAVDKFLTSAKLQAAGLLTPRTIVCQTAEDALQAFADLGGDIVLKPLFGSEGRGLTRLNDEALAERAFKMLTQLGAVLYLQEFLPHQGHDLRLFVLGNRVFGMQRSNPLDWRTNVSRGATTSPLEVTPALAEIAHRAAAAVGAEIAGVDLLPAKNGREYVLEVNAVPGWKALAKTLRVDIAAAVLAHVTGRVMSP